MQEQCRGPQRQFDRHALCWCEQLLGGVREVRLERRGPNRVKLSMGDTQATKGTGIDNPSRWPIVLFILTGARRRTEAERDVVLSLAFCALLIDRSEQVHIV